MKTQREYNGVCKVPSQVLPSAADLKRLQKKRKKMEDQLKAKGDSEDINTGIFGTKNKDNRAAEGDVKKSPTSTKSASKNDSMVTRDVYVTNDKDAEKPSKSLVHETSRRFLLQRRGQAN
ncbi:hypothetical protein B9Z55_019192 [Caenorhabditis nigoni]|uniref:Uncharacterized protein n=1 Tax=Caenorhabditis nigoni TaxID=1611254 RepID=A0A2G5TI07_9PELO|nr:hypothetical protein B9Z55_019192 [Caenorhabditis nigoni]